VAVHPNATAAPPLEVVLSEFVASLAFAAHSYLAPSEPDLGSAEIAIEVAADAFERIAPRLSTDERSALAALLTDLRMTFVRKRGL
jgi:hypothetical protein